MNPITLRELLILGDMMSRHSGRCVTLVFWNQKYDRHIVIKPSGMRYLYSRRVETNADSGPFPCDQFQTKGIQSFYDKLEAAREDLGSTEWRVHPATLECVKEDRDYLIAALTRIEDGTMS